jgi:endo-alpha-1,4-polygalactosaminidase (GH114 family)
MGCLGRPPEPEVVVTTKYQEQNIPTQEAPKSVQFPPVDWFVITEDNLEEKIAEIDAKTGNVVVFAITPKGYENLALGIAELRRYVKDQQAIIAYYEEALTPDSSEPREAPAE